MHLLIVLTTAMAMTASMARPLAVQDTYNDLPYDLDIDVMPMLYKAVYGVLGLSGGIALSKLSRSVVKRCFRRPRGRQQAPRSDEKRVRFEAHPKSTWAKTITGFCPRIRSKGHVLKRA